MNKTQSHSGRPGWLFLLHLIMLILGVSAYFHDAAAAIVLDGKVLAAAQEERFTRVKSDASFPIHAIKYCMEFAGATLD